MRYVTTNIRLPEDLWRTLKSEAIQRRKRLSEVIRELLFRSLSSVGARKRRRPRSLCGIWKGVEIPDSAIEEAKKSLFPPPERFLS